MTTSKPRSTRASDLNPLWHVIDAEGKTLGRVSTEIAVLLQGKHKPMYVPYLNTGDYVVVVNAEKVRVTGKKLDQKMYYRHSGYHGGLTERTLGQVLDKTPTRAISHAVKGMLPKNALGRKMLSRLKVYSGADHPHEAQVRGMEKAREKAEAPEAAQATADKGEEKPTRTPRATRRVVEATTDAPKATADAVEATADAVEAPTDAVEATADAVETTADAVEADDDAV